MNFCEAVGDMMMIGAVNNLLGKDVQNFTVEAKLTNELEPCGNKELKKYAQLHFTISFDVDTI